MSKASPVEEINLTSSQEIAINIIHPNPWNPKRPIDDEFTISVNDFLINAILLRPHPDLAGQYQIACGERRWEAYRAVDRETIRSEVRNLTDEQVRKLCLVENNNRKDFTPAQRAQMLKEMVDIFGDDVSAIASALGWSAPQVRRASKLLDLSETWAQRMKDVDLPGWSSAHFESLSCLREEEQEALAGLVVLNVVNGWTVQQLQDWIGEQTNLLKSARWDLDDSTLVAAAGACSACQDRSSCQVDLLADVSALQAGDRCLNTPCWERKAAAWLDLEEAKAMKRHGRVVRISKEHDGLGLPPTGWTAAKKGDDGAVAALVVSGKGYGKIEWVVLPVEQPKARKPPKKSDAEEALEEGAAADELDGPQEEDEGRRGPGRPPESMDVRRQKKEEQRWALAIQKLIEILLGHDYKQQFRVVELVPMAIAFGIHPSAQAGDPWKAAVKMRAWDKVDLVEALLEQVVAALVARLRLCLDRQEAGHVADWFGIDLDALKAAADLELPDPAAWATTPQADKEEEWENVQ